jgi:hypothetical protein
LRIRAPWFQHLIQAAQDPAIVRQVSQAIECANQIGLGKRLRLFDVVYNYRARDRFRGESNCLRKQIDASEVAPACILGPVPGAPC